MEQKLPKSGCYALPAGENSYQQIELPLRNFSYQVQLADSIAYLQLQQTYFNSSEKILNVDYIFPVNPNAAIINFQISFGGHTSKGIIKSKYDAQNQYQQNYNQNRGVGFGGYSSSSSKDIMKVKIGNINPKEEIKVKLALVYTVSVAYNTFYQFRLSTTITPRYVSRLDPTQLIWGSNKGVKMHGACTWSLKIRIKSSKKLVKFFSNTHTLDLNPHKIDNFTNQIMINEQNMKPDKDFMLYYTFQNFQKPSAMINTNDNSTQAIISFVPKFFKLNLDDAQKYAIHNKQISINMSLIKGQYIFFLDRSGSMEGNRIDKAKQSLIIFLKSLPVDSFFNIVSFGSRSQLLFNQSRKYQKDSLQYALSKIEEMKADMGGTQIKQALAGRMKMPVIPEYTRHIYLLTDGAVSNTADVIAVVARHIQYTRVHSIGIGNGCSEDLITGCAQKGKGYSIFITDKEDPSDKIIQILQKSLSPVITNMHFSIDQNKVQSIVPNPKKMPYVLKNQVANFFINFNGQLKQSVPVQINYSDSLGNKYSQGIFIRPDLLQCNYIGKMASFIELNALYNIYKYKQKKQDHIYFVKQLNEEELGKQIIKQSIQKQILTQLTAFICVDSSKSDQYIKAHLNDPKQSVNIKPVNPKDHILKVTFGNQYGDSDISGSDQYIDQCCMVQREESAGPPSQYPESKVIHKTPINFKKAPVLKVIAPGNTIHTSGIILKKGTPPNIMDIVKQQQINGKWKSHDIIDKIYNPKDIAHIQHIFSHAPKQIWQTLAIIQWIQLFHPLELKKLSLILRKAKQFIDMNSKSGNYQKLNEIWKTSICKGLPYKNHL